MKKSFKRIVPLCFLGLCLLFFPTALIQAQEVQYPDYVGYVNDFAGVMTDPAAVENQIAQFEAETSNEIAVVTIDSLEGVPIEEYAVELFEQWGIGKADKDNGVLLLAAIEDRQMRIEVGYGLEGALTDSVAGSIIRQEITPPFKDGNYQVGIEQGVQAIIEATKGEYVAEPSEGGAMSSLGAIFTVVGIFVFVAVLILIIVFASRRRGGPGGGGKSDSGWTWTSGSSSGSSGFSGGGGSFGGGSSGGGGASGSW